jgi:hypothetical protein
MRKLAMVLALVSFMQAAHASTIYAVNEPLTLDQGFGTGSIIGTITTDGTLGAISYGNLQSWNLNAQVGSRSFTFDNSNSGITSGLSGLSATENQLLFDFTPSNSFFFSVGIGTGYILGWQSGCNSGLCGLLVASLGFEPRANPNGGIDLLYHTAWAGPFSPDYPNAFGEAAIASVPGPVVGAGLPGLLVAIAGFICWRRSRRSHAIAA